MGWYEAFKDIVTVADRLRDAELKQRLAAVQVEGAKLAEENAALRLELVGLREQAQTRQGMYYRDNVYWKRQEDDEPDEGPYCPACLDGANKAVRMPVYSDRESWTCKLCKCDIRKPGAKSQTGGRVDPPYF
jgi:hypothetical protein